MKRNKRQLGGEPASMLGRSVRPRHESAARVLSLASNIAAAPPQTPTVSALRVQSVGILYAHRWREIVKNLYKSVGRFTQINLTD